ncbi:MAG TPA: LamG-like jellyroll fold domain-containing protein, partial [Acidothermaceae bacterium]|nr:LamG-like jellyroll fold domain-containing protein [Acidothermaceae bacterium]
LPRPVSNWTVFGGFVGRTWLWFLGGCLVVTLVPLLFGWRPYVVESSSMAPRIKVGDVILAAPEHNPQKLLGRVTVFHDPDPGRIGSIKSHRVVAINSDGTLTTKGDANQSADSVHVKLSGVIGLGRLLVRYVGLPLIWVQKGEWWKFALLLASIWFAALLVMRDRDEVTPPENEGNGPDAGGADVRDPFEPPQQHYRGPERRAQPRDANGRFLPKPRVDPDVGASAVAVGVAVASSPEVVASRTPSARAALVRLRQFRPVPRPHVTSPFGRFATKLARRTTYAVVASLALLLPTAKAAFSATTFNTADTWNVPTYNYTTETNNLGPYLYWKLDDTTGTTAADTSGNNRTGTYNSTWTKNQVGALVDQTPNVAATEANAGRPRTSTSCVYTTSTTGMATPGPMTYSEVIWFKTTSTDGGKLIGLENNRIGVSDSSGAGGQYDRMMYMDSNGEIWFGVWTGAATAIHSVAGLNDGNWHMAAATMSTTSGMSLYIDGKLAATSANTTSETETKTSYWRVGCGNLAGWGGDWTGANAPGNTAADNLNYPFNGSLDEATVWFSTLTSSQIAFLYWIH